jgi:hypothetical protein
VTEDVLYSLANLCSLAYDTKDTLVQIFGTSVTFDGVLQWTFDPSNFLDAADTHSQCFITTTKTGTELAIVFRGSEVHSPVGLLKSYIPNFNAIAENIREYLGYKIGTIPLYQGIPIWDAYQPGPWWRDWFDSDIGNVNYYPETWPATVSGSRVGNGFLPAWLSLKPTVERRLKALIGLKPPTTLRVFITGHSLGAALAILATVDIWQDVISAIPPPFPSLEVVTLATPYVGNAAFGQYWSTTLIPQFGNQASHYRDPNDIIQTTNALLALYQNTDPYVDVRNAYSTIGSAATSRHSPSAHLVSNYLYQLRPYKPVDASTAPGRRRNAGAPPANPTSPILLAPDDPVSTLIVRMVTGGATVFDPGAAPSPITLALRVGSAAGAGRTPVAFPLTNSTEVVPFLLPGQTDTFCFTVDPSSQLQVSDFQTCQLVWACSVEMQHLSSGSPSYDPAQPLLLDGLQVIVNGVELFSNFGLGISLSMANPICTIAVPTPHYVVVGGRFICTPADTWQWPLPENATKTVLGTWGTTNVGKEVLLASSSAWTTQYNQGNLFTTLFVVPEGGGTPASIVGGRFRVTNDNSTKPWIQAYSWGEVSANELMLANGYTWAGAYQPDYGYGYGYQTLYVRPGAIGPVAGPMIIGGRLFVTDDTSKAPGYNWQLWGEQSPYEIMVGSWYDANPGWQPGYCYAYLELSAPVATGGIVVQSRTVTVTTINCEHTSEGDGFFQRYDEVYIKQDGTKIWPTNANYYSMKSSTSYPVTVGGSGGIEFSVKNIESVILELWDEDDLSSDDELVEYTFAFETQAYDYTNTAYVALKDCSPNQDYWIFGTKIGGDDTPQAYVLIVRVSGG